MQQTSQMLSEKRAAHIPALLPGAVLQRKCACSKSSGATDKCEDCANKDGLLQRRGFGGAEPPAVPPIVPEVLSSPGQPLDADARMFFEQRFGHDFSRVRIHTDARAEESAQRVNALAYTVGHNLVFAPGRYAPVTTEGRRLLAHELTHVVQQSAMPLGSHSEIARPGGHLLSQAGDPSEQQAERVAKTIMYGSRMVEAVVPPESPLSRDSGSSAPTTSIAAMDDWGPPTLKQCNTVLYWKIRWSTTQRDGFIVQEIKRAKHMFPCSKGKKRRGKEVTLKGDPPSHYWEAWRVEADGTISPKDTDTWVLATLPDTEGEWNISGKVFWTHALDPKAGLAVPTWNPDQLTTVKQPQGLGSALLSREEHGTWNCCEQEEKGKKEQTEKKEQKEKKATPQKSREPSTTRPPVKGGAMLQRRSLSHSKTDDELLHSQQFPDSPEVSESLSFGGLSATVVASKGPAMSAAPSVQDTGFTVNAPNDLYEQEADRVSQEVMNLPEGEVDALVAPKLGIQRRASAAKPSTRLRDESLTEEQATPAGTTPRVTPQVDARIRRAAGGGEPLPVSEREFFEPRFGHDFSKVRVHSDAQAASLAEAVDASAFTLGHNIFFNSRRYQPSSPSGRHLLAHELTHVVQQGGAGETSQVLQRAKIGYTTLGWGNYKDRAPAGSQWAAVTSSGIGTFKHAVPKPDVVDTEKPCKIGKKDATEFTATVSVDPDIFDGVQPFMTEEKSWVKDRYRDGGHARCVGVVRQCEAFFERVKKLCLEPVSRCEKAFRKGPGKREFKLDSKPVTVSSQAECATTFNERCQEIALEKNPFTLQDEKEPDFLKVKSKKECKKEGLDQCTAHEKQESARVLKHEQGHFDISRVMAEKLRSALKAKAEKLAAKATKCGEQQAIAAALKSFNAKKPWDVLDKIDKDWMEQLDKAQTAYDKQTDHGLKDGAQTTWEKNILEGLTHFVPGDDRPAHKAPAKKVPAPAHAP
jgi:Domain of unknown function (DUF4157)